MDKFEKIMREKLQNHDAGMDGGAWEQFAQRLDKSSGFENAIREKLKGHDAGMPKGAWEKFSQRFDQLQPKQITWKHYMAGGIAAAAIGLGIFYFAGNNSADSTKPVTTEKTHTLTSHNTPSNNAVVTHEEGKTSSSTANNAIAGKNPVASNEKRSINNVINNVVNNNRPNNNANTVNNNTANNVANNNNNTVNANATNNNASVNNNTVDKAKATNNNGNSEVVNNSAVEPIMVKPDFTGYKNEVCQNTEMTVKTTNNKNGYSVSWLLNGEEISNENSVKLNLNEAGMQQLQLVYTNNSGKKTSAETVINVLPSPNAGFSVDKVNEEGIPEYSLTAHNENGTAYLWNFGDGKFSTEKTVTHLYKKKGTYSATLSVTGANGCQAKFNNKVQIDKDYNLLAPNAFTPNGSGPVESETFIPRALLAMDNVRFKMTIMDRSGKTLFQTSSTSLPWDGMDATTGTKCSPNVYIWTVQLTYSNGTREMYQGSVHLME